MPLTRGPAWDRTRDSPRHRRLIDDLTRSLALVTEPDVLYSIVTARFLEIGAGDGAILWYCQSGREYFEAVASCNVSGLDADIRINRHGTLANWLQVNDECLLVPDSAGVVQYLDEAERRLLKSVGARVCVPMLSVHRLVGMVFVVSQRHDWTQDLTDLSLLCLCGRHAALACENLDQHRAEHARVTAMHRAQQLAVAGQLAATVAHEVRNPLTAIRSTIQLIVDSNALVGERQTLLRDVLDEVDRIEHTVAGILSLSRPHEIERSDVDMLDVIRQAIRLVHSYAESRGVEIEVSSDQPLAFVGDARELRQVIVNLLLNACQAMDAAGSVRVDADVVAVPGAAGDPQPMARIRITDMGPGMTEEEIARAFDPFYTTKRNGTGLGLPICLEILDRHGARLVLSSTPGAGTTASIFLPSREA